MTVSLGERSYPISIGAGLFQDLASYWPLEAGDMVMVITNKTLAPLYLSSILEQLAQLDIQAESHILPDGEEHKNLTVLDTIFSALLKKPHSRDTTLIALGGGVIGDTVGFAAACYQRGVRFLQFPTTLLSQVDSSVGGKTAVNHALGKNMIGAFYQPTSVIIDTRCLTTLPSREFASGLAEVIKYGVILDTDFFDWLDTHLESLQQLEPQTLAYCIRHCCELKAAIVAADEREAGQRALLNLGHTFGHAIETHMGYGNWLHGEAVAVGMVMAAKTAERLGLFTEAATQRLVRLLMRAKLPVTGPSEMIAEDYLPHMLRDKKVIGGILRLVLPTSIGSSQVVTDVPHNVVLAAIDACQPG